MADKDVDRGVPAGSAPRPSPAPSASEFEGVDPALRVKSTARSQIDTIARGRRFDAWQQHHPVRSLSGRIYKPDLAESNVSDLRKNRKKTRPTACRSIAV
jgi:hypothetical protein